MSNNKYLAERLFDDFWGDGFPTAPMWTGHDPLYGKHVKNLMKTDVRETENSYELDIDLPGFQKEEMTVELRDGYLSIRCLLYTSKVDTAGRKNFRYLLIDEFQDINDTQYALARQLSLIHI